MADDTHPATRREPHLVWIETWIAPIFELHAQVYVLLATFFLTGTTVADVVSEVFGPRVGWWTWTLIPILIMLAVFATTPLAFAEHNGWSREPRPRRSVRIERTFIISARVLYCASLAIAWSFAISRVTMWLLQLIT